MEIGKKIKELRNIKGITQDTLADKLGVTAQAVSKWETCQASPDIQLLPEIAVYFGVTVDELFSLAEDKEFDRIQNMLWDERFITQEQQDRAESWLLRKIEDGYRPADCYALLADMYNHRARSLKSRAEEYAWESLMREPGEKGALAELNEAMNGYTPDWYARNHHLLINRLNEYLELQPDNWRTCLWLLDNLMDDYRFDEAEEVLLSLEKCDATFRTPLYKGLLKWHRGDKAVAYEIWNQMGKDFPDDWMVYLSLGDVKAMEGKYEEAIAYYRKGVEVQKAPRYVDSFESMAHIYELMGDPASAIRVYEEELVILREEWDTEIGETADIVRREIARLRKIQKG